MNKRYLIVMFLAISSIFFICCDKLNSPEEYLMIPEKIQITDVTYYNDGEKSISLSWGNYMQQHTGFQITRDSKLIVTLDRAHAYATIYTDYVKNYGTYEYRIYALNGNKSSFPSYIKIRLSSDKYYRWYD